MKKIISLIILLIINLCAKDDSVIFLYQSENSLEKEDKVFVRFNNRQSIEIRQVALCLDAKISMQYKFLNKDTVYLNFGYLGARWNGYQYLFKVKDNHLFLSEVYDYQLENGGYMCKTNFKQISEGVFQLDDTGKPECGKLVFFDEMKTIISDKQFLYKEANKNLKTKMYLIKNDKVQILEEKENWIHILFITRDNKEIKGWIPKSALE